MGESMELDFICGQEIDAQKATEQGLTSMYDGCTYVFCSRECKQEFDRNPSAYANLDMGDSDGGEDLYTY